MKNDKKVPTDEEILSYDNVPCEVAARYLGRSGQFIRRGLIAQRFPFGAAVDLSNKGHYTFQISPGALVNWKRGTSIRNWIEENREMLIALLSE